MEDNDLVWFAVVNPHAGSGKTIPQWDKAQRQMHQKGIKFQHRLTDCKFHAVEIAYSAAKEGFRKFIAVGGDGTVHEILRGIMHCISDAQLAGEALSLADFTLAVIPIGSGNDWIKSHNIPHDTEQVIQLIADGAFAPQDIVRVTSSDERVSYMVNIGGIGLDARICEKVNAQKDAGKSGRLLYVKALISTILKAKHFAVSVVCDGRSIYEGPCLSIAFGTGKYSGGGFRQTPEAVTDDGLTEVTVIPALPFFRIAKEAHRLMSDTFLEIKEVIAAKAKSIEVLPVDGNSEMVEADGEVVATLPVRLEILPSQLNVLHRD